jgi:D-lactate dehydrogenase (cytochrome)
MARIEFMDGPGGCGERYSRLELAVKPTLLMEFHGMSEASVEETARLAEGLAAEHGGLGFDWQTTAAGRERFGRRGTMCTMLRGRCGRDRMC